MEIVPQLVKDSFSKYYGKGISIFNSLRNLHAISYSRCTVYIPLNIGQGPDSSVLANICCIFFLDNGYLDWYEVKLLWFQYAFS